MCRDGNLISLQKVQRIQKRFFDDVIHTLITTGLKSGQSGDMGYSPGYLKCWSVRIGLVISLLPDVSVLTR